MNEEDVKKSLIEFINKKMKEMGNTDVKIGNIRVVQRPDWNAFVDVSFTWYLNGWAKPTDLTNVYFAFRDGEWHTSTIF